LLVIAGVVGAQGKDVSTSQSLTTSALASTPISSTFTYQGQLKQGTTPINDQCDFQFGLWTAASVGTQVGITQTLSTINVVNGLFTVSLDFGANAFSGNARWLAIAVRCPTGSGVYTPLNPRQPITPAPYAMYSIGNWGLNGNSGTSASNFLGTTDNTMLTLGVSNTAALRLISQPDAPIVIGGYAGNAVNGPGDGATVAGGGSFLYGANVISGTNVSYSTIGGGVNNRILGTGYNDTIGGGYNNVISGTYVNRSTIGGGEANTISNNGATVGGGNVNTVGGQEATVGGGLSNIADGDRSMIGGGWGNNIMITGTFAHIGGGRLNTASGYADTISGGNLNNTNHYGSSIGGGDGNTANADRATIGGGYGNLASGYGATIPGGLSNSAAMSYTLAAGQQAQANHQGTFVWADSTNAPFASTGADQFLIRAKGGVGINTNAPARSLDVNGVIGVFDGGTRTYYGGLATEESSQLIELGINDSSSNRFGGGYNVFAQGGMLRVDTRAGQNLFQFYGRIPGNASPDLIATLNNLGALIINNTLTIGSMGSAGSSSLCLNSSNQVSFCSSSLRYKNNVENLQLGLETVARLRPVTFNWKTDGASDLGFVAEEVNQVSPLLTTLNQDGQIEGVKYDRISAVLVKAVQEQQQQIAELKTQNATQQQEIAQLKRGAAPDQPFNLFNLFSVLALGGVIVVGLRQKRGGLS
jgi:hypothetical protein